MSFLVIGITGKAGAGKDTIADHLVQKYGFAKYGFADPLKKVVCAAFDLHPKQVNDPDEKEKIDNFWSVSPRQMLQFVGTELFRDHADKLVPGLGSNFWVARAIKRITQLENLGYPGVVINDVRFKNEADLIVNDHGGVLIRVVREGIKAVGIPNHISEAGFDTDHYGDSYVVIYNTGSKQQLYEEVDNLYTDKLFDLQ